jgi:hypothetical protein
VKSIWDNLPNSTIARGFLLAKRIMHQVIKNNGNNTFLEQGIPLRSLSRWSLVKGIVKKQIALINY